MDGERMNKPARARGSRIYGPPLRRHRLPWQEEEEDLFTPDEQDEGMEDPGSSEIRSPPRTRGWAGCQRNGLGAREEARAASPD